MSDERNLYGSYCDFWDDCVDHFERSGGLDSIKQRDEVDQLHQLLMTGQSFTKIDPAVISGGNASVSADVLTPSPPVSDDSCNLPEPSQPATETQLVSPNLPAPNTATAAATTTTPTKPTNNAASANKLLKHKCDTCSQVFDSKIALSIHTGRIHKHEGRDKNYQCQMCPKAFFNSSYLAQHMRIHTGNKPYPCPECDKRFTQLSHLQQHKRTHTGEKPYKCQQPGCSKAFSQLSNLQSHTRSHLPDGNVHKCTSCYKCYYDEASLNAHMRTHMENKRVRNYRCEECGKSYTQDTYLQNHINNKHAGGSSVTDPLNSFTVTRRPLRQPTSIQAATSMICKMEEPSVTPCGFTGMIGQQAPPPPNFPQEPAPTPIASSFPGITQFSDSVTGVPAAPAAADRSSYHDTNSAFKPVLRPAFNTSIEPMSHPGSTMSRPPTLRPYEQPCSGNMAMPEPGTPNADIKPNPEEIAAADSDFYWRMKSNMAGSSAGVSSGGNTAFGNYSHLPAQIQNYMASQVNYHSYASAAAYMSGPLDGLHATDKLGSAASFNNDAMCDYLMGGGLREAYQYD